MADSNLMSDSTRDALHRIESALADMLESYAEMRSEYLRNAHEDHRLPLQIEIAAFETAARLVRHHRDEDAGMGLPSWRWHEWEVREREISGRLDEFLVIPRADIVITEYGWQRQDDDVEVNGSDLDELRQYVRTLGADGGRFYEYIRHPVLLPEDGTR
ncbi:hypothetical protein [Nocardia sp. NPDC049149]|uniref:hypothetical protein n=1 Tax=Nocardia sp. NPDC049149 TaxID=3364315 RepID=UPI00371B7449